MKRILIVSIAYRVGERIYPIIPKLAKEYVIDVLRVYQMHYNFNWPGTYDMRNYFEETYNQYFDNIFFEKEDIDYSKYDLIIYDDCRINNGGDWIYQQASCPVISCSHGNGDNMYLDNVGKVYDKLFLFGQQEVTKSYIVAAGIPSNDKLLDYLHVNKEHILVVVNFLEIHNAPFKKFNKKCIDSMNLVDLQAKYNLPIVIKLKSRHNNGSTDKDRAYIDSILPSNLQYTIVVDTIDDNLLIAQSILVLGAPSTLMTKPIQLKIPTLMFLGYGQTGIFKKYSGLIDLDKCTFNDEVDKIMNHEISDSFIDDMIAGGSSFNCTDIFIKNVKQVI
jgi:hypothetical protein